MNKVILNGNSFEIIIEVRANKSLEELNKTSNDVAQILQRNSEELSNIGDNEDFIVEGEMTIVGVKEDSELRIISIISKENTF